MPVEVALDFPEESLAGRNIRARDQNRRPSIDMRDMGAPGGFGKGRYRLTRTASGAGGARDRPRPVEADAGQVAEPRVQPVEDRRRQGRPQD